MHGVAGVEGGVRGASGGGGDAVAGGPRVRPASLPVHRSGQGPPAARGDGGGDQRLSDLGLAGRRPACGDADVAVDEVGGPMGHASQRRRAVLGCTLLGRSQTAWATSSTVPGTAFSAEFSAGPRVGRAGRSFLQGEANPPDSELKPVPPRGLLGGRAGRRRPERPQCRALPSWRGLQLDLQTKI